MAYWRKQKMHFLAIKASWQLAMTLHSTKQGFSYPICDDGARAAVDILAVKTEDWVDKMEF